VGRGARAVKAHPLYIHTYIHTYIFERRILRYIFEPVEENGTWRKYRLFNEIRFINVKKLEWAGHVVRAIENIMIKKIFNTKPE
jgi:hypothetical protein